MNSTPSLILVIVFVFAFVMSRMAARDKERKERIRLLEQAMNNPNLRPEERADLIRTLRPFPDSVFSVESLMQGRTLFLIGWLSVFVGIGFMASGARDEFAFGAVASCVGLGLVTLPMALREYEAKRRA
jgi:hypothetical protein